MLKMKNSIDLKELEKYGFKEYNYCWNRIYKSNGIITAIKKDTKEIFDIDTEYGFFEMKILGESTRVNDLIKDGLIEKVDE